MIIDTIYNTNCLGDSGMCIIPDKSIDMILCDLPYGTTACKWDTIIPFPALWDQYTRIIKDPGVIALTASQPFTSKVVMSNPKLFRYEYIWQKEQGTNYLNANKQPLKVHENVLIFYNKQPVYNQQLTPGKPYITGNGDSGEVTRSRKKVINVNHGTRKPTSILKYNRQRGLHPTQKPVQLFEYLIKTYTNEGGVVLDNCMGSGTTAIACINTNRHYIGFEQDSKYYDIILNRITEHKRI